MRAARNICVQGIVQGVGFRPFVFRLASVNALHGWVLNAEEGLEIYLEGREQNLESFIRELKSHPPPAASISTVEVRPAEPVGVWEFSIRDSIRRQPPTVQIAPDQPLCGNCLDELFDRTNPRYRYPYINCTDCGPRYSIIRSLPYDRPKTTMQGWDLCPQCACQYADPSDRRFHAQPLACPECGPHYFLQRQKELLQGDTAAIRVAAQMLTEGKILAVKGLGGYHLACNAKDAAAVFALRERKFRKEKPFAVMAKDVETVRRLVELSAAAETLLISVARPIVLGRAKVNLSEVAPETHELGVMLPYAPLHYLLFSEGAPEVLVMTSANRSNEPIAYRDADALEHLSGVVDGFLVGERPIARRVDDSVAREGAFGPVILRRSRGYAPGVVATLPIQRPVLALGADLKNAITLVVDGQAFVTQHIGDLDQYSALKAFKETIQDLLSMYEVSWQDLLIVHDCHPHYFSTMHARSLSPSATGAVQHHRAHVASVLAEREAWDERVIGVTFDGTGYGDDGTIWGGEIFVGSVVKGFERVAHLRSAALAGGDAAARYPVQAAAGFLGQAEGLPTMIAPPFLFPTRYQEAQQLVRSGLRSFPTTSVGRLFDTVAALLGFTRQVTFEGQAAMWLQTLASGAPLGRPYPFPFVGIELDFRPLLHAVVADRVRGRDTGEIARAFHRGIAEGLSEAIWSLAQAQTLSTVVLSGGVFQNELLMHDLQAILQPTSLRIWTNSLVPPNDGGLSLGQAALAAFGRFNGGQLQN